MLGAPGLIPEPGSASLQRQPLFAFHSQRYEPEPARAGRPAPRPAPPSGQAFAGHVLAATGDRPGRGHRVARHRQLGGERAAGRPLNRITDRRPGRHAIGGSAPAHAHAARASARPSRSPRSSPAPSPHHSTAGPAAARVGAGLRPWDGDASPLAHAGVVPAGLDAPVHGERHLQAAAAMPFQHGHQVRGGSHRRQWPAYLEFGGLRARRRVQHDRSHPGRASDAAPLLGPEDLITRLQRYPSSGSGGRVRGRRGRRARPECQPELCARGQGRLRALRPPLRPAIASRRWWRASPRPGSRRARWR